MDNKSKNLMIAGRFILGLSIIGGLEYIAVFIQHSPMLPLMGMVMAPPLALLFLPPVVSAIYFMFSSKMRWRIDILLFLISIICIIIFARLPFSNL